MPSIASAYTCHAWIPIAVDEITLIIPIWPEQATNDGVCLTVTAPTDGETTNQQQYPVSGTVGAQVSTLTINSQAVTTAPDLSFSHTITLTEGANTLLFEVTDTAGLSYSRDYHLTLDSVTPVITVVSPLDGTVTTQTTQSFSGYLSEAASLKLNGSPISVRPDNSFLAGPLALAEGPNNFTFEATDGGGNVATTTLTVTRDTTAPVITLTSPADGAVVNNATLTIQGNVSEAVTNSELTMDSVPVPVAPDLIFTTNKTLTGGLNNIAFSATDLIGNPGTANLTVTLNRAPQITSTPVTSAKVDTPVPYQYSYDVDASDADGHTLTYTLTQSPAGMTINSTTGVIDWTPSAEGSEAVTVEVSDGYGLSDSQSFTLTVAVNQVPVINSLPPVTASVGVTYAYQAAVTDPDNSTLTYTLIAAPTGMTIDGTGLMQWTPASAFETADVVLEVDDGDGGVARQTYKICE